ncbi:MAG: sigma-54 dependent transcriptional regulator [Bdellovibrionota bacterium]
MARILLVDDEPSMREVLEIMLRREGHESVSAPGVEAAKQTLGAGTFDIVITDLRMPDGSGLDVLGAARQANPDAIVLVITAFATADTAIEAMKGGAYDYITKPFKIEQVRHVLRHAIEAQSLKNENRSLRQALVGRYGFRGIVGASPAMKRVFELIERIKDTRTNVLLTGESGTGKELVARAIHYNSVRKEGPFVAINCGAIPGTLLESELFGHAKGSFTGAVSDKAGLFEQASGGTLFLDEVSEIPVDLQVKLLRSIQERTIRAVGGTVDVEVDVRIVAATNRNLAVEVEAGRFRQDLYYRLNVVEIHLPPLRERKEDIPLLALHFLQKYTTAMGRPIRTISPAAMRALEGRSYPGNIRELENVIERAVVLEGGEAITPASLPPETAEPAVEKAAAGPGSALPEEGLDLEATLDAVEKKLLVNALERSNGNKSEAAKLLKLSFRSFRYRCAKYGL